EPAELPARLIKSLRAAAKEATTVRATDDEIPKGRRNETLFALACSMRYCGANLESIQHALETENRRRCKPPLAGAEVKRIARSAAAYQCGDLFNSFNLFEPPSLGAAAYHGLVGEIAETIEPYTEAPAVGIIAQALAATGMVVGDGPSAYAGMEQPTRVNIVL